MGTFQQTGRAQPPEHWALFVCVILVGVGLVSGCTRFSSDSQPIPDSTFVQILTELHITAARHNVDAPTPRGLRDSVFARYGVRAAEFDSTVKYYSRRPEEFKELYSPIIDTLESLQFTPPDTTGPGIRPIPSR